MTDPARPSTEPVAGFRADLEGLRAVAVILVLLYHAAVPGFSGGYVGVDVFFVLSGFLITGLLLREVRRTRTVSLPGFYARRARRLLPAAALVLLVTMGASALVLPPLRVPDVAGDVASAALYVSNLRFAVQATDYLQAELAPSPVLHYWSLSVEEQFYLFWPAIVLLVAARRGGDPARRIGVAAAVIAIGSLALSIWLTVVNQPWAFFSLPTRAWELGLGAILAVSAVRLTQIPMRVAAGIAWIGLVMVGLSGVVLSTSTPFPGIAALLPTVGAALVIAGGARPSALAPGRWLAMSIPRFLGRISYSLYLWHWPLLVLPAVAVGGHLSWWARGGLVLLAIALAAGTQRWVEDPLRHGRGIGTIPRRNLALAGALSVVVATTALGMGVSTTAALVRSSSTDLAGDEQQLDDTLARLIPSAAPTMGRPVATLPPTGSWATAAPGPSVAPGDLAMLPPTPGGPLPAGLRPSLADARDDKATPYTDGCHVEPEGTSSPACTYGDPNGTRTVVLMGDSHAVSWFPAVERLATDRGWRFLSLTKSACGAADIPLWNSIVKREYAECRAWRADTLARIAREHPALVLVASSREFQALAPDGSTLKGTARTDAWQHGMTSTLAALRTSADRVVLLADTPRSDVDVPVCLSAHQDDSLACATPVDDAIDPAWTRLESSTAGAAGVGFVDPTRWVCPTSPCPAVLGRFMVLRDEHHLSTPFAAALSGRLSDALQLTSASR